MEDNFNFECVTQEQIAEWLCMERHQLCWIIKKYGADKVVDMLDIRGHYVWYELINKNVKFYQIGERK